MSEENKKSAEDGQIVVQETNQSISNYSRASRLVSAIKQVKREETKGTFDDTRKQNFLKFLNEKITWENETDVPERDWDQFFAIIKKMIDKGNVETIVTPAVEVLTKLFIDKHEMIDQSEIFESDEIQKLNFGKLLENNKYKEYTDFVLVTTSELFTK